MGLGAPLLNLWQTLTYTSANMNNLTSCLDDNKFIYGNRWNLKKRHSHHNLQQTFRGIKSVCTVWIRLTEHFQSHPRTSFSMNEVLYDQCKQTGQQSTTKI